MPVQKTLNKNLGWFNTPQFREYTKIRDKNDTDLRINFSDEHTIIYGKLGGLKDVTKDKLPAAVETFLDLHGNLFGSLKFRDHFKYLRIDESTRNGPTYVIFRQYHNDVPIYGTVTTLALDREGNIRSIDSLHSRRVPPNTPSQPRISASEALEISKIVIPDPVLSSEEGLYFFLKRETGNWHLVRVVDTLDHENSFRLFIDTITGDIIEQVSRRMENCATKLWANPPSEDAIGIGEEVIIPVSDKVVGNDTRIVLDSCPDYTPSRFKTYEKKNKKWKLFEIDADEWPPDPNDDESVIFLRTHAVTDHVLKYFYDVYEQVSWGGPAHNCGGKPCPLDVHGNAETEIGTTAWWAGDGQVYLSKDGVNICAFTHEFTHALVAGHFMGHKFPSCNKAHPEAPSIEEGLAFSFARIICPGSSSSIAGCYGYYNPDYIESVGTVRYESSCCGAHYFGEHISIDFINIMTGALDESCDERLDRNILDFYPTLQVMDIHNLMSYEDIG